MAFDLQLRVRYVLKIKILIAICHLHLLFWYSKGKNPLINNIIDNTNHLGSQEQRRLISIVLSNDDIYIESLSFTSGRIYRILLVI